LKELFQGIGQIKVAIRIATGGLTISQRDQKIQITRLWVKSTGYGRAKYIQPLHTVAATQFGGLQLDAAQSTQA